jgi:hypothetical protein
MRIFKSLKKAAILVLTAILFTTTFTVTGAQIEAKAATNEVSMYYQEGYYSYYQFIQNNIFIKVSNLGYNKNVVIHYTDEGNPGIWKDEKASYLKTLSDGSEIWIAGLASEGPATYSIKYEVNGATYWDNNSGNNYNTATDLLGVNPIKNKRHSYYEKFSLPNYTISATVKNLAYNKIVKVRYTEDNWVTSSEKSLSFSNSISGTNCENWNTVINLNSNNQSGFQYYVYYQVNGQTYYDNNFGLNYNIDYNYPEI